MGQRSGQFKDETPAAWLEGLGIDALDRKESIAAAFYFVGAALVDAVHEVDSSLSRIETELARRGS